MNTKLPFNKERVGRNHPKRTELNQTKWSEHGTENDGARNAEVRLQQSDSQHNLLVDSSVSYTVHILFSTSF